MASDCLDILRVQDEPEPEPVLQGAEFLEHIDRDTVKVFHNMGGSFTVIDISDRENLKVMK